MVRLPKMKKVWWYVQPFRQNTGVWRTDICVSKVDIAFICLFKKNFCIFVTVVFIVYVSTHDTPRTVSTLLPTFIYYSFIISTDSNRITHKARVKCHYLALIFPKSNDTPILNSPELPGSLVQSIDRSDLGLYSAKNRKVGPTLRRSAVGCWSRFVFFF